VYIYSIIKKEKEMRTTYKKDMTHYEKACAGMYLMSFAKNGNLMRTAEQFESGNWVVHVYHGKDISGEYAENEFKQIYKFFKK
jgi:hypothetical protein